MTVFEEEVEDMRSNEAGAAWEICQTLLNAVPIERILPVSSVLVMVDVMRRKLNGWDNNSRIQRRSAVSSID